MTTKPSFRRGSTWADFVFCLATILLWVSPVCGDDSTGFAWKKTGVLAAPEAFQAAAADEQYVYAVTSSRIAKYDRASGKRIATSTGEAKHLNSGFLWKQTLYCAHSNYPQTPQQSEIKRLDLVTMRLSTFKHFGDYGGSLTWAVRHQEHWWCNFARYGDDNAKTFLVKFDDKWQEKARWTYPSELIPMLGRYSLSGGLWRDESLLVTDHDHQVLYRLRLPPGGTVLQLVDKQPAPFTGQGIAHDPRTGGLIGINRAKRQVVFASLKRTVDKSAHPILVAHRGLLRHAPENTLPAFAACLELGFGFELDIRTTKDGRLVVLHDDGVGRTTNGSNRSVRDLTLAEVKQLDAGRWFDPAFAGVRIPTLEETLALVKKRKHGPTIIALNIKHLTPDGEQKLVMLVQKYGLFDETFAFDQNAKMSRRLKKLNPKLRIGRNVNRKNLDARLQEDFLDVFLLTFAATAAEVSRLHRHGKQVVYNFGGSGTARRNPAVWNKVRAAGIDGMLTDYSLECRVVWRTKDRED